ncbi:hypothetical protein Tco_1455315 [Tanacetum coccineum]
MLTPKPSSYYNGQCSISLVNPEYLKKAQWEKPCLYNVKYDKNDLANLFAPESEETIRLEEESRSKLGDLVKPYDYTKLNNLYDLFVPQQQKSREQLYFANDLKKNICITSVQKRASNLVNHIEYVRTNAFISKSKQAFKVVQGSIDNIRAVVEFLKEYDLLLQECLSKDLLYVVLLSFDDIDEYSEMACKYLGKIEECERLETEVPKSHKQKHDKKFAQLEQHCINLELALQHAKEKNVCENSWERQLLKSENNEKVWKAQNYSLIAEPPPK